MQTAVQLVTASPKNQGVTMEDKIELERSSERTVKACGYEGAIQIVGNVR